jgi:magnesium transporter
LSDLHDGIRTHDEWGSVDPGFVARIVEALDGGEQSPCAALVRDLHAADLADVLQALEQADRVRLITSLGRSFDVEALAELDEAVRDELMEALPNEVIASAIKKLDTDDALYLIEDLEDDDQREILSKVSKEDRAALSRGLHYEEYTAGRLMKTEFVAIPLRGRWGRRSTSSAPRKACPTISSRSTWLIRPSISSATFPFRG